MLIEFVGLPGSGKSTITQKLSTDLKSQGITNETPLLNKTKNTSKLKRNIIKLSMIIMGFVSNPILYIKFCINIIKTSQRTIKDLIKVIFNFLFQYSLYIKFKKKKEVFLIDEGLIQATWAVLFSSKRKNELIKDFIDLVVPLIISDYIVFVGADTEVINIRLKNREGAGGSRLERGGNPDNDIINESISLFNNIKEELLNRNIESTQIISVNNNKSLEDNIYFIKKQIKI